MAAGQRVLHRRDRALVPVVAVTGRVLEGVVVDAQAPVVQCRSCGALIWWGLTRKGRMNPFDVVDGARTAVTHFSTCPDARNWKRR